MAQNDDEFSASGFAQHKADSLVEHDAVRQSQQDVKAAYDTDRLSDLNRLRNAKRLVDQRLLVLYGIIMVMFVAVVALGVSFERGIEHNCQQNRQNTVSFNSFITKAEQVSSAGRSATMRQQITAFYEQARQSVPSCPRFF